jgi:lipid-A-disaccharide synthase
VKRIFLVAGERSGDTYGALLIRALRAQDPELRCEGLGGEMMAETGMELRHDLAGEAIMGFTEVVKHLPAIRRLMLETVAHLEATRPDALVLIDYPGFNLRLAKRIQDLGIPIIYYISPQVWAWKKKRIHTIAQCVDKMLVIFPFEEALYEKVGLDCAYVGHPLLDHIVAKTPAAATGGAAMVIGLLPGSRAQEISRLLEPMLGVARGIQEKHPEARFQTPCVDAARAEQVRALAGDFPLDIKIDGMDDILHRARFCLVASGTATIETTLYGVPMLICYRVSTLTFALARYFARHLKHIGMVNILAKKEVVPEFIQAAATPEKMLPKALELIDDSPARTKMLEDLADVHRLLGDGGASENAAREVLNALR